MVLISTAAQRNLAKVFVPVAVITIAGNPTAVTTPSLIRASASTGTPSARGGALITTSRRGAPRSTLPVANFSVCSA